MHLLFSQVDSYPRDTTYSIRSAFRQIIKQYPEVLAIEEYNLPNIHAQRDVIYKNLVGHSLRMDIFYPSNEQRTTFPGILMIHGGGWASGSKANQVPMAQKLAEAGYVAIAVEYRLSPEAVYPAGVEDLKDALKWLRAHASEFGLDKNKIATLGCSAGATLASLLGTTSGRSLTENQSIDIDTEVQAVINIDGIVSFVHPEASPEWTGRAANQWLGKYNPANLNWRKASPLEYAGEYTPPFLFINSAQPRFHAGRDDLLKILDKHRIYQEVHTIENSPHSFWLVHPWFEETLQYTINFLKKIF